MSRAARWALAGFVFAAPSSLSARALAGPQWSSGAVVSGCLLQDESRSNAAAFCGALRTDVLFGRGSTADVGVGPYATLGTAAFDDLRSTLGMSVLLPVLEDVPLVLSAGGLLTSAGDYGADAKLFFGVRSYNFHGVYNFASGVVLGVEQGVGAPATRAISLGVQVDGLVFAVPVLLALGALR